MLNNRIPFGTILGSLTKLFQPLMFADGDGGGAGGDGGAGVAGGDGGDGGGAEGGQVSNWRDSLPDDIKNHATLTNFKSVVDLAKSHLEAQNMIGRKGIIPPVDDSEEEKNRYYNELGRPETADGYKLDEIKAPEGVEIDENVRGEFLKVAHKLGLQPHQVNGLIKWQVEGEGVRSKSEDDARIEAIEKAETDLRKEWGTAYDANLSIANKLIGKFGDKEAVEALKDGLGHNPSLIRMMANIAKGMSEDTLGSGSAIMVKTPAEAQKEISQIQSNKKHAYFDVSHIDHQEALKHMKDLYTMAYPEEKK